MGGGAWLFPSSRLCPYRKTPPLLRSLLGSFAPSSAVRSICRGQRRRMRGANGAGHPASVEPSPFGGVVVRKLMPYVAALGAVPIVMVAAIQTAAPALADTPGVSPTCFPQSANPHPTDPAGQTTNTLFCTSTNSNGSGAGGSGSTGSGSGSTGASSGGGTTAGSGTTGGQTSLAGSTGSGTAG